MRWAVLAALSLLAACPKSGGGRQAVPTEVDVEWPDAAVFPDAAQSGEVPDEPAPEPGSGSGSGFESPPSPMAPSMSAGSSG